MQGTPTALPYWGRYTMLVLGWFISAVVVIVIATIDSRRYKGQ